MYGELEQSYLISDDDLKSRRGEFSFALFHEYE